jgi:hypothetical protein
VPQVEDVDAGKHNASIISAADFPDLQTELEGRDVNAVLINSEFFVKVSNKPPVGISK